MRVLLREVSTRLFYVGPQQWSYEARTAKDFATITNAEQHAAREHLRGMEMVLITAGAEGDVVVPLESGASSDAQG